MTGTRHCEERSDEAIQVIEGLGPSAPAQVVISGKSTFSCQRPESVFYFSRKF